MNKRFKAVLVLAMLLSAALGVWLIMSPTLDKQKELAQRQELLDRMESESVITEEIPALPTSSATSDGDDTADSTAVYPELADVTTQPATSAEPPIIANSPVPEAEPVILEPIDDSEFPDAIKGIGILTIEKIELRLPVAEGIDEKLLRIAPGRITETAEIGSIGNAVIVGHRNYDYGDMFNRLGEIGRHEQSASGQ
jgi:hypothetical protein